MRINPERQFPSNHQTDELRGLAINCGLILGALMILFWILGILWQIVATLVPYLTAAIVVGAFQVIVVVAGGIVGAGLSIALFLSLLHWAIERFAELEEANAQILRDLRKQSPSFLLATTLIADCVLVIADKSFGDPTVIVCVTVVLVVLFGYSNHLFARSESVLEKTIGWVLWGAGLLLLPFAVMLSKQWTPGQLFGAILSQGPEFLIVCIASFLLAIVSPFALKTHSASREQMRHTAH